MICNATYDSHDAIPEALREEFENVNGRWQLKSSAVPGVGPLFNSSLAANEQRAVGQVKTKNARIKELEEENSKLTDEVAVFKTPGATMLSKEDTANWDKYTKLGTPDDVEKKIQKVQTLEAQVRQHSLADQLREVGTKGGLNPEVLADWAGSDDAQNLEFSVKDVDVDDGKGNKVKQPQAFVKISTKNESGVIEVTERNLLEYAKEKMPSWKYDALTTVTSEDGKKKATTFQQAKPVPTGSRIPDLGKVNHGGNSDGGEKAKSLVDQFNAEREAGPSPFKPRPTNAQ